MIDDLPAARHHGLLLLLATVAASSRPRTLLLLWGSAVVRLPAGTSSAERHVLLAATLLLLLLLLLAMMLMVGWRSSRCGGMRAVMHIMHYVRVPIHFSMDRKLLLMLMLLPRSSSLLWYSQLSQLGCYLSLLFDA